MTQKKIRQATPAEALAVLTQIPEFGLVDPSGGTWEESADRRLFEREYVALIATGIDGSGVGALIAYQRYEPGILYCWLAGVFPSARRQGALTALMREMTHWGRGNGFTSLHIATRNRFHGMLSYLVRERYLLYDVERRSLDPANYVLRFMKDLEVQPS